MKTGYRIVAVLLLTTVASTAPAQVPTMEDFLKRPELVKSVRLTGTVLILLGDPVKAQEARQELKHIYWAFKPDAGLTEQQKAFEEEKHKLAVDRVAAVVEEYGIEELSFAGLDFVCLGDCQNWYFAALRPRGPVLIKAQVMLKDGGRFFGMTVYTDWDVIKKVNEGIQVKPGATVMSIKRSPPVKPETPDK